MVRNFSIVIRRILAFYILSASSVFTQELNEYGLHVIDDPEVYLTMVEKDSSKKLEDLTDIIPGIVLDIKYATEENFLGKAVYKSEEAFLRIPAALALKNVQAELKRKGLELKIFDAYRPYSVTVEFYKNYDDSTFVASPWKGSRHNRGCAVDLTLIKSEKGEELEMPTSYDDFTEKANALYMDLPDNIITNRKILIEAMEKNDFKVYEAEWWHFDFKDWKEYELMDIPFEELKAK